MAGVAPGASLTDAGTVSTVLLLSRVTIDPPAGALSASVTLHVPVEPGLRLMGQVSAETRTGAARIIGEVFELLPSGAGTGAVGLLLKVAAVALKVAVVPPAATLTEAGTESDALLLASV